MGATRTERIRAMQDPEELLEMAEKSRFQGEENGVVLEKILAFEGQLTQDDWPDLEQAAEPGSELHQFILARIGSSIPAAALSLD